MVQPSKFILTTDFATYKNDAIGSFSFTIPASIAIPASGTFSYTSSQDFTIGTAGAPARTFINSSASPTQWFFGPVLQIFANGTDSITGPTIYQVFIYITRPAPTTVRANVLIPNTGAGTLTTEGSTRTITVKVDTFIPPFS